jgi:GNAT superfamily N-acetyltransferase
MSRTEPSIEIEAAKEEDIPEIVDLLRMSLGEGRSPRHEDFFRWKHERNPFGRSPILLARAGGRVVALRSFLRWDWKTGANTLRAVRAVDTSTHPSFQGRGLFKRLTLELVAQLREEGAVFVFNTPNEKSRPGYLKMGWRDVARVSLWARPATPLRRRFDEGAEWEGLCCALAHPRLAELLDQFEPRDLRLHTRRTREYLAWRYRDIPGFTYSTRFDLGSAAPALVVYRRRTRGPAREATVLEVLCGRSSRAIARAAALLRGLAADAGVHYLAASAALRTREAAALLLAGFVPLGARGPRLTALPLCMSKPSPLDPRAWRASAGDLELF